MGWARDSPIETLDSEYFIDLYKAIAAASRRRAGSDNWAIGLRRDYPMVRRVDDPVLAVILACCDFCEAAIASTDSLRRKNPSIERLRKVNRTIESDRRLAQTRFSKYLSASDLASIDRVFSEKIQSVERQIDLAQKLQARCLQALKSVDRLSAILPGERKSRVTGRPALRYAKIVPILGNLLCRHAGLSKKIAAHVISELVGRFGLAQNDPAKRENAIRTMLST